MQMRSDLKKLEIDCPSDLTKPHVADLTKPDIADLKKPEIQGGPVKVAAC